jgi:16S rRNA (cytosine967-C5)-methyltransferase
LDIGEGRLLDEAVDEHTAQFGRLDRALAAALVFGVCRWRSQQFLDRPGKRLKPAVRLILALGAFQIWHFDRVPVSAAVNESVSLTKKFGPPGTHGMVNAVLRAMVRQGTPPDPEAIVKDDIERSALTFAHPEWLVERWIAQWGREEAEALMAANNVEGPLTLRVNSARIDRDRLAALLADRVKQVEKTKYSPDGLVLSDVGGPIGDLPGFAEGYFGVQDEAAQIVGYLARPQVGGRVLDACAGLGGKSLHLADLGAGEVIGLDTDWRRLAMAAAEARRTVVSVFHAVQGDLLAAPFPEKSFDAVMVDAPCSNLGVIRRRPDVKWSKTAEDPARLAELQTALLDHAAKLVRPTGKLVYAVCTHTQEETLGVVDAFWMNHLDFGLMPAGMYLPDSARELVSPDGMVRTMPHRHGTDGFFAVVFERKPDKPAAGIWGVWE